MTEIPGAGGWGELCSLGVEEHDGRVLGGPAPCHEGVEDLTHPEDQGPAAEERRHAIT